MARKNRLLPLPFLAIIALGTFLCVRFTTVIKYLANHSISPFFLLGGFKLKLLLVYSYVECHEKLKCKFDSTTTS